jgi:hypothetical protein
MVVDARKPGTYAFWFEVENTGRLPLTFDAYEDTTGQVRRISAVQISEQAYESTPSYPRFRPLDGAVLEPGDRRVLQATVTMTTPCRDRGFYATFDAVGLRYGYGPFSRSQSVRLPFDLTLLCKRLPRGR